MATVKDVLDRVNAALNIIKNHKEKLNEEQIAEMEGLREEVKTGIIKEIKDKSEDIDIDSVSGTIDKSLRKIPKDEKANTGSALSNAQGVEEKQTEIQEGDKKPEKAEAERENATTAVETSSNEEEHGTGTEEMKKGKENSGTGDEIQLSGEASGTGKVAEEMKPGGAEAEEKQPEMQGDSRKQGEANAKTGEGDDDSSSSSEESSSSDSDDESSDSDEGSNSETSEGGRTEGEAGDNLETSVAEEHEPEPEVKQNETNQNVETELVFYKLEDLNPDAGKVRCIKIEENKILLYNTIGTGSSHVESIEKLKRIKDFTISESNKVDMNDFKSIRENVVSRLGKENSIKNKEDYLKCEYIKGTEITNEMAIQIYDMVKENKSESKVLESLKSLSNDDKVFASLIYKSLKGKKGKEHRFRNLFKRNKKDKK